MTFVEKNRDFQGCKKFSGNKILLTTQKIQTKITNQFRKLTSTLQLQTKSICTFNTTQKNIPDFHWNDHIARNRVNYKQPMWHILHKTTITMLDQFFVLHFV